jgi:ferredoxin
LTRALKLRAAELGISATGVAEYDPKYTYVEHRDKQVGDRVVICALENDWEATQIAPSTQTEKAKLWCNMELQRRMGELQDFLVSHGYRARVHRNELVLLHYAVEAGIGQLGLNGQVLTPHAGSRCRFQSLITDAPLLIDSPQDYGIPKICDACQICVRRCPAGAITFKRRYHRGVEKAKINTARCAPTLAKAHHCAVCIKVCPVQRYGLKEVVGEYERSGRILGKDSSELETYEFEGYVYGPGERPTLRPEWFQDVPFDKNADTRVRWAGDSKDSD